MPPKLSPTATLDDVRSLIGLHEQEWETFLRITSERSKNFGEGQSAKSWQSITPAQRTQVYEGVQQDLKDSGLPQIHENVVRWRLSQVSSEEDKGADGV